MLTSAKQRAKDLEKLNQALTKIPDIIISLLDDYIKLVTNNGRGGCHVKFMEVDQTVIDSVIKLLEEADYTVKFQKTAIPTNAKDYLITWSQDHRILKNSIEVSVELKDGIYTISLEPEGLNTETSYHPFLDTSVIKTIDIKHQE